MIKRLASGNTDVLLAQERAAARNPVTVEAAGSVDLF